MIQVFHGVDGGLLSTLRDFEGLFVDFVAVCRVQVLVVNIFLAFRCLGSLEINLGDVAVGFFLAGGADPEALEGDPLLAAVGEAAHAVLSVSRATTPQRRQIGQILAHWFIRVLSRAILAVMRAQKVLTAL